MSNGEGSASKVNMFSSWYGCGFFLSFMALGTIRVVGVVGVVGVMGSVVRDGRWGRQKWGGSGLGSGTGL